jgi:2-amino-4-hydroxy-6-hydroxymethyldihydropteridine diphosphokinase
VPRLTEGTVAHLALGSNIGDKIGHLRRAVDAISTLPRTRLVAQSSIYRTPPWGKTDQDWFANAAVTVETGLSPQDLLVAVLDIEKQLGRVRRERWGPRVIDIDVLMHGETVLKTETLTLPHPAMTARAFVLVPLNEIAPDAMIRGKSVTAWLAGLDAKGVDPIAPPVRRDEEEPR